MIFIEKESEWYANYWESVDGEFAIGVEKMLFGRIRIIVLHKSGKQYWGIMEYPTYRLDLIYPLVFDIIDRLDKVEPKDGNEWWTVFEALPPKRKKYLEDDEEDESTSRWWECELERAKELKLKFNK